MSTVFSRTSIRRSTIRAGARLRNAISEAVCSISADPRCPSTATVRKWQVSTAEWICGNSSDDGDRSVGGEALGVRRLSGAGVALDGGGRRLCGGLLGGRSRGRDAAHLRKVDAQLLDD